MLFVYNHEALVVKRFRRLPQMQKLVDFSPTDSNIVLSLFILFYRVKCKLLLCKTNLKLKVLKSIKSKFIAKH